LDEGLFWAKNAVFENKFFVGFCCGLAIGVPPTRQVSPFAKIIFRRMLL